MKLWIISQNWNKHRDAYSEAIVAAKTEEDARNIYPYSGEYVTWNGLIWVYESPNVSAFNYDMHNWTSPNNVSVEFLSDGYDGPAGTILAKTK